jgi:hypothetical protein
VYLSFAADVYSVSRLVENENFWIYSQPLAEDNLLSVATGERGDNRLGPFRARDTLAAMDAMQQHLNAVQHYYWKYIESQRKHR